MLARALDLFFPPQCLNCETLVPTHGTLCLSCWQQVQFIADPMCGRCGLPFEYTMGEHALCGECMRAEPSFSRARSAFRYDEHSKSLILKLKYHDQLQLAPIYGTWLAKAGKELVAASDVVVPVPMHYFRFISRRYNQSALLAKSLAKHAGLSYVPDGLKRIRRTPPQAGLTRAQRIDNVKGAFATHPRHTSSLKGKSILLVDDVMTTGATLEQCAKALLKSGAQSVNVLTLARTVN
jgi:ComF family protein